MKKILKQDFYLGNVPPKNYFHENFCIFNLRKYGTLGPRIASFQKVSFFNKKETLHTNKQRNVKCFPIVKK